MSRFVTHYFLFRESQELKVLLEEKDFQEITVYLEEALKAVQVGTSSPNKTDNVAF